MHNKKNITIMILLIMLSFAIISEVSAVDTAEADGTGSNPAINSVNMTVHDFASESNNKFMQNPVNDHADDFKSLNEQESFNSAPHNLGDGNEPSYEHDMDSRFVCDEHPQFNESAEFDHYDKFMGNGTPMDFNQNDTMPPHEDMPLDNDSWFGPAIMPLDNNSMFKPEGNGSFDVMPMDLNVPNSSMNLRNDNFTNPDNGELMNDVVSNLMGLNNIAPKIKDDKNKNMTNPPADNRNASAPQVPGDKNSSNMWSDSIKDNKDSKVVKKSNSKKITKKSVKKAKTGKKARSGKKSMSSKKAKPGKSTKKGMAKL